MNRPLWKELRREYEAKGEKHVPYSCRHGYAHRAHVICDLPPACRIAERSQTDLFVSLPDNAALPIPGPI